MAKTAGEKTLAYNRRIRHDYFVDATFEAGIELKGTEVKSIRMGRLNFKDSYCFVRDRELILTSMHISHYEKGNIFNVEPERDRKLLMHRQEITKLSSAIKERGVSIVPLRIYLKKGLVKVEIAVVRGKKLYDKRQDDAKRSADMEMSKALSRGNRSYE